MMLLIGQRASGFRRRAGQPAQRPSWGALAVVLGIAVPSIHQQTAIAQDAAATNKPSSAEDATAPASSDDHVAPTPADQTSFVALADSPAPFLRAFNLHKDRLRFVGLFSPS